MNVFVFIMLRTNVVKGVVLPSSPSNIPVSHDYCEKELSVLFYNTDSDVHSEIELLFGIRLLVHRDLSFSP